MFKCLIILLSILSLFFLSPLKTVYAEGTYANIGTADAADGGPDAINFSQGRVWTIDKYGKYIWMTEDRSNNHHWAWSNDSGANWTQGSETYSFLTRASVAYDSVNDILHIIWVAEDSSSGGGVIYRRYSITRDGSNNITSIQRVDSGVNLQLDYTDASAVTEQPVALWVNDGSTYGELIAVWSKNLMTSSRGEVRASMRKLSNTNADGTAGNWLALDGTPATFSVDPPQVAADKIFSATSTSVYSAASVRGGSGARKNDIYIFAAASASSNSNLFAYRGIWNSSSTDWSSGIQAPVTLGSVNSQAGGYSNKAQLLTRPVLDTTNDRLYMGWARWKDNTAGDTWSFAYLDSSDTASSTLDAYSANGTHSYAPTGDIAFDATTGLIYISYIESTTNGTNGSIDYKTFDGSSLSSQTRFYTNSSGSAGADGGADIPILYDNRQNSRMLFAFRVNGALPPTAPDPHKIFFGYITPVAPTNTPTPTPTLTPTPTSVPSSSSNSSVNNTSTPPACTTTKPSGIPNLFQIDASSNQAILYFSPITSNISYYYISYGYTPGDQRFGVSLNQGSSNGVLSYTINELSPSSTYYFKIRPGNGCMTGDWSNEMKITTTKKGSRGGISYYKDFISRVLSIFPKQITQLKTVISTTTNPITNITTSVQNKSCKYTVSKGESLWSIAKWQLGDPNRYGEIIKENNLTTTRLLSGQVLNIGC